MNLVEVTNVLKLLGWSVYRDEVGDRVASFRLSDRVVSIIYGMKKLSDGKQLWVMCSVSTDTFSNTCALIDPGHGRSAPLLTAKKGMRIKAVEILEEHVQQASNEAIAWAREQDLDKALQDYARLPTSAPGTGPIFHLAALVLLGDIEKLKSYQANFEVGNRLSFVNYITKEFIDRSVMFASPGSVNRTV
jgi:hypothetical protein